jgi:hypothetical protein
MATTRKLLSVGLKVIIYDALDLGTSNFVWRYTIKPLKPSGNYEYNLICSILLFIFLGSI